MLGSSLSPGFSGSFGSNGMTGSVVLFFVTTKLSVFAVKLPLVNTTGFPLFPSTVMAVPLAGSAVMPYSPSLLKGTSCLLPFLSVRVTTNLLRSSLPLSALPST